MAEERLRRNLDSALDPGPDFPSHVWLSRTMTELDREGADLANGRRPTSSRRSLVWLSRGRRLAAVIAVVVVALAATATFLSLHKAAAPIPAHVPRYNVKSPGVAACGHGDCVVDTPVFSSPDLGWLPEASFGAGTSVKSVVFRTTDGGRSWRPSLTFGDDTAQQILAGSDGSTVLVVGSPAFVAPALFESKDGGLSWHATRYPAQAQTIPPPQGSTVCGRVAPHVFFINPEEGWIVAQVRDYSSAVVMHTTDGGSNWAVQGTFDIASQLNVDVTSGLPCKNSITHELPGDFQFLNATIGYYIAGTANPVFFRTGDGGQTWKPINVPIPSDMQANPGFPRVSLFSPSEIVFQFGQYILVSHDGGTTWQSPIKSPLEGPIQFIDATHWSGWPYQGGWVSTADAGGHWRIVPGPGGPGLESPVPGTGLPGAFPSGQFQMLDPLHGWALIPHEPTGDALYATADGGVNWTPVGTPELN